MFPEIERANGREVAASTETRARVRPHDRFFTVLPYNRNMSDVIRESSVAYGAKLRPMTVAEYYLAAEQGVFGPQERLELIEGEVIQKMSPQKSLHATAIQLVSKALTQAWPEADQRIQLPLHLGELSEPEPDVVITRGTVREYTDQHPGGADILLAVEVSDTTLPFDRGRKAPLYAKFGIPELWIVSLQDHRVEVYTQGDGHSYLSVQVYVRGSTFSSRGQTIAVDDLLP